MPADPWLAVATVAGQGLTILAWWLRLRWQARQEQTRIRALVDLAEALRDGGAVDEQRPDGSWLTLCVNGARDGGGRHGGGKHG